LAALLDGTPAVGISQTLRRGTRNGIRAYGTFTDGATYIRLGGHRSRWASAHILVSNHSVGTLMPVKQLMIDTQPWWVGCWLRSIQRTEQARVPSRPHCTVPDVLSDTVASRTSHRVTG